MRYERIKTGIFQSRPNRFIALVELDGKTETCHVKNTGRCRELLSPGAVVYLQDSQNPGRKTRYDVIAVKKGNRIVNIDSQIPNKAVLEWLKEGNLFSSHAQFKPEQCFGNSRFDLYIEDGPQKAFMEIKGVTLEEDGIARFPDAPTERGCKHVRELCNCMQSGYDAYLLFLIQMKGVRLFEPNWETHQAFGEILTTAHECGVHVLAYDSLVTADSIHVGDTVKIRLDYPVSVLLKHKADQ